MTHKFSVAVVVAGALVSVALLASRFHIAHAADGERIPTIYLNMPYSAVEENYTTSRARANWHCQYQCKVVRSAELQNTADMAVYDIGFPGKKKPPVSKPTNQIWVASTWYEAPYSFQGRVKRLSEVNHNVDYVISYRADSDFIARWVRTEEEPTPKVERMSNEGAKGLALWFVSNCSGERINKFKSMLAAMGPAEKSRTVAYGKCFGTTDVCGKNKAECLAKLYRTYKFYLAFENSRCKDYITEKLARAYNNGMVPVVLGGYEGRKDYERVVPANSFIHVQDFKTSKELVDYLKYLDSNKTAYLEYFDWQKKYSILTGKNAYDVGSCELCKSLYPGKAKPFRGPSFDLRAWWQNNTCVERRFG